MLRVTDDRTRTTCNKDLCIFNPDEIHSHLSSAKSLDGKGYKINPFFLSF